MAEQVFTKRNDGKKEEGRKESLTVEEVEEEKEEAASVLRDAAKEGMLSSVQALEGGLGLGDFLSSGFSKTVEEEEQDEDAPEELELETGVTLTAVDDAEVDNGETKVTCCRKTRIVMAALFVLPIVNVFSSVLSFILISSDTAVPREAEVTTVPVGPTGFDPASFCSLYPEQPYCQQWLALTSAFGNTSQSLLGRRKKRSASLCDVLALSSVCVGMKTSVKRRSLCSKVGQTKTDDDFDLTEHRFIFRFQRSQWREKQSVVRRMTQKIPGQFQPSTPPNDVTAEPKFRRFPEPRGNDPHEKVLPDSAVEETNPMPPFPSHDTSSGKTPVLSLAEPFRLPFTVLKPKNPETSIAYAKQSAATTTTTTSNSIEKPPQFTAVIPAVTKTRRKSTCNLLGVTEPDRRSGQLTGHRTPPPPPPHSALPGAEWASPVRQPRVRRAKRAVEEFTNYDDGLQLSAGGGAAVENHVVVDTYQRIYGLSGIVSGVAITVVNYRGTAVGGAVVSGLACVLAAFLPGSGTAAMVFLLGVLPGIGNNLLVTSVLVALMEYFRERPLRVLSIQEASGYLATIVFFFVQNLLFPKIGVDSSSWANLLQYQAATYAIAIVAALTLTPLNLHMRDAPEESLRARMLNISGLAMLKSPLVYVLAAIFFFTGLGADLPRSYIEEAGSDFFLFSKFLGLFIAAGALLGSLVSSCVARCQPSLPLSLVLMAVWGTGMGGLTLTVQIVRGTFHYAIAYCAIFGLFYGLRKPLMYYVIPLTLGTDHLPLAVGLTSSSSGLGSLVADKSSEAIMKDVSLVDGIFYLSGLALLTSVGLCVLLLKLLPKTTPVAPATSPSADSLAPGEGVNDQGEAQDDGVFTIKTV